MYREQLHFEAIRAFHVTITLLSPRTWGFDNHRGSSSVQEGQKMPQRDAFSLFTQKHYLLHRYAFIEEGAFRHPKVSVSRETNTCNPTSQITRR